MLNSWFCLGGEEIINNERARGYAESASMLTNRDVPPIQPARPAEVLAENLFTNPRFEATSGDVTIAENLFTNPGFRATDGTVEVRRNRLRNAAARTTNGWSALTGASIEEGDGSILVTCPGLGVNEGVVGTGPIGPVIEPAAGGISVRAPEGATLFVETRIGGFGSNGARTNFVATGEWQTITTPPSYNLDGGTEGADALIVRTRVTAQPIQFEIRDGIIEGGTEVGEWFDGNYSPDPDLTPSWTGTPDVSESILTGLAVADMYFSSSQGITWQSQTANGKILKARISPTVAAWGLSVSAMPSGDLTFISRVRTPWTGSIRVRNGGTGAQEVFVPVVAGVWTDINVLTTGAGVANTGFVGRPGDGWTGGDIFEVEYLGLFAGVYTGPYFDGSQQPKIIRNIFPRPKPVESSSWNWNGTSGGAWNGIITHDHPELLAVGIDTVHATSGGNPATGFRSGGRISGLTIGQTYTFMLWSYHSDRDRVLGLFPNTGSTALATGGSWAAGESGWRSITWVADRETPISIFARTGTGSNPEGYVFLTSACMVVEGEYDGDFLSGYSIPPQGYATAWEGAPNASPSYLYDDDFTVDWAGTPDASVSRLRGVRVEGVTSNAAHAVQSSHFLGAGGSPSMRLIPNTANENNSFAQFIIPAGSARDGGVFMGTIHLENPLTGDIRPVTRCLYTHSPGIISDIAPNEPGRYGVRMAYGGLASIYQARLYNGASQGNGDVWWTDVGLYAGDYDGPWFSGSSPQGVGLSTHWTGAPDASTSILQRDATPDVYPSYCDASWFVEDSRCDTLALAVAADPLNGFSDEPPIHFTYTANQIAAESPWFTPSNGWGIGERGEGFLGAYCLEVRSLSDRIREVQITEGITDGGILGRARRPVPTFTFRVLLTAVSEDALEYGHMWLSKALDEATCSTHGPSCGSADLTFFTDCPPPFIEGGSWDDWVERANQMTRVYHDVKCIDGPITVEEIRRPKRNQYGRIVEFTLAAGVPQMFSIPSSRGFISQAGSIVVQDSPRNDIPYPSAEVVSTDLVVMSTNHSTNPSVETNDTGWDGSIADMGGSGASIRGRVTGELSAVGNASYRNEFTASAGGTVGKMQAWHLVPISGSTPRSFSLWAAAVVAGGSVTLGLIELSARWLDAGGTVLRIDAFGTVPASGGAASLRSVVPPAGAVSVRVTAELKVDSWATSSVIRLYADAAAVTIP